ncbi:hypothetical protein ACMXYO_01150 [Neptuniibacter sp. QD37_6]|uniref:hypothetical protein n=1 Tax=Neptuniibacter sp. QD37_6 TaxID=3398210 RepID=UPI0039F61633
MDKMDQLLAKWKEEVSAESDHFVEDGIICQEGWNAAERKILFILKETNGYNKSITKLINIAVTDRKDSALWKRPTFHNIGRWGFGLLNISTEAPPYKAANKERKNSLLSCAFINIKKTSGGRTAGKEVSSNAEKYASYLREQIEIISPDIIVFGGTYKIMKKHVLPEMEHEAHRIHKYKNTICINANHPACTKKRTTMYDQVIGSYANYIKDLSS